MGARNTYIPALDNSNNTFEKEIHINNNEGVDDILLRSGQEGSEFKTIAYVQSLFSLNNPDNPYYNIGNSGIKFIIHGGSTENITITQQNVTITACHPTHDGLTYFGDITLNSVGGIRLMGLKCNNLIISGSGSTYIEKCQASGVFSKTGTGYLEFNDNCDLLGVTGSITGTGAVVFQNSKTPIITLNNASAALTVRDCMQGGNITVTNGVLLNINSIQTSVTNTSSVISSSATGIVYLINCSPAKPDNTSGRLILAGLYSIINTTYDVVNSNISGTNLGLKSGFDNIVLKNIPTVSGKTTCFVQNTDGSFALQTISSGGTSLPANTVGLLGNDGNGTLTWRLVGSNDLTPTGVIARTYVNPTFTLGADGRISAALDGSNSPTGPAGGSLTGIYPNPTLTNTGVIPNNYNNFQIGADGRVYSARPLNDSDIPSLDIAKITTGTLPIVRGGTNNTNLGADKSIAISDGNKISYLPPPSNPGDTLNFNGTNIVWSNIGGSNSLDPNNVYVSTLGNDTTGIGSLSLPFATIDKAITVANGLVILGSGGYGSTYINDLPVSGIISQYDTENNTYVSFIETLGGTGTDGFRVKNINSSTITIGGYNGGCKISDVKFAPITTNFSVILKANNLTNTPTDYVIKNSNLRTNNNATYGILLYPAPAAYPATLVIDNCENVKITSQVGAVQTENHIPDNWTIKYRNCTFTAPSNSTSLNFISLEDEDRILDDLATNGTKFNGINQIAKTDFNGKLPKSIQNIASLWVQTESYVEGEIVIYSNTLYRANGNVSANTSFTEGLTGATFKAIAGTGQDRIVDMISGLHCTLFRTMSGRVYGAKSNSGECYPGIGETSYTFSHYAGWGIERMRELTFYNEFTQSMETGKCIKIAVQGMVGYALMDNGNLYVWGRNNYGALGLGTSTTPYFVNHYKPQITNTNVVEVYTHPSGGSRNEGDRVRSIIKKTDGKIYGCGFNEQGGLGLNNTTNISYWTELTWCGTNPVSVWNLGSSVGVLIVQKSDLSIWGTGRNNSGCLGNNATTATTTPLNLTSAWMTGGATNQIIKKISGGFGYWETSGNQYFENSFIVMWLTDNANTTDIIRSCGNDVWLSLGNGATGSITVPTTVSIGGTGRITQLSAMGGAPGKVSVLKNGKLYSWGYNELGGVGNVSNTNVASPTAIKSAVTFSEMYGDDATNYGMEYYIANTFARATNGTFYYTGRNTFGQGALGHFNNVNEMYICQQLNPNMKIKKVDYHYTGWDRWCPIILLENGQLMTWGYNGRGFIDPENQAGLIYHPGRIITPNISLNY